LSEIKNICKDLDRSNDGDVSLAEFSDWVKRSGARKEIAKAKAILAPSDDDGLEGVFYNFCGPGHSDLDCRRFVKMFKDCDLLDKQLTEDASEQLFLSTKLKPKTQKRIGYFQFEKALEFAADLKGVNGNDLRQAVIAGCPIVVGTKADSAPKLSAEGYTPDRPPPKKRRDATKIQSMAKATQVPVGTITDNTDTWRTFGLNTPAGRNLKGLYSSYKPPNVSTGQKTRWPPVPDTYVVLNPMRATTHGLQARKTMHIHDFCQDPRDCFPWGSRVQGERVDTCWLKVGDKFLPIEVAGFRFLRPWQASPRSASAVTGKSTLARTTSLPVLLEGGKA
jgi:hypothetical protein